MLLFEYMSKLKREEFRVVSLFQMNNAEICLRQKKVFPGKEVEKLFVVHEKCKRRVSLFSENHEFFRRKVRQ